MAKVRIRKAGPGEKPGYYNKTAMFMKKAQDGMQVESDAPTSQEEMLQAYYMYAYGQLVNDVEPDNVYNELVDKGLPQQIAVRLIDSLMDRLTEEGEISPEYKQNKEAQAEAEQEQPAEETSEEETPAEAEDESMYEEDQEMADLEEGYADDRSYMQDGGESEEEVEYSDDGESAIIDQYDQVGKGSQDQITSIDDLIANTPGIQPGLNFPSLAEYVPDYQEIEWQPMDALESSEAAASQEMKRGGYIKKKDFVKNVMSLLKKQDGGEGEEDKSFGKGNPMDTLTDDVKKHKNNFLDAIKTKATKVKTEEMYDKMMKSNDPSLQQMAMQGEQPEEQPYQMGGMTGGEDPLYKFFGGGEEDPDYYEADFLPEAQYGANVPNATEIRNYIDKAGVFARKGKPKKGQTYDEWYTSDGSTPGFAQDYRVWDGEKWTGEKRKPNTTAKTNNESTKPNTTVPKATIKYVPRYHTGPGSFRNVMLPWNPIFGNRYMLQGSPYMLGSRMPYMDPLTGMKPVARHVSKRGILGRPKQWTDIYSVDAMGKLPNMDPSVFKYLGNISKTPNGVLPTAGRSNTSGLTVPSKAAIIAGEAAMVRNARRLGRNPELLEVGPSATETVPDNSETEKFLQQRKQQGYVLDENGNWIKIGTPRMEIRKPQRESKLAGVDRINYEQSIRESGSRADQNRPIGNVAYEERNRRISPSKEKLNELYSRDVMEEQKHGGIHRFIPKANNGLTINNPNLPQPSPANPDLAVGNQAGMLAMQPQQQAWSSLTPNVPQQQSNQPISLPTKSSKEVGQQLMDSSKKKLEGEANMDSKGNLVGIDYKRKRNFDGEAAVNLFNAGLRGVTGLLNRKDEKRREAQMYDNMTSDNLYAAQGTKHRGDWVDLGSQMGQFRFDQMGQDRSGFSSYGKYGGFMQDGGEMDYMPEDEFPDYNPNYEEGDEVYMTDDDIQQFMANGGQIEYI